MVRGLVFVGIVACAALATSSAARAEDTVSAEQFEKAKAAFTTGVDLFEQGDFQGAARAFEEANTARPHVVYLYNLGLTYERLGDDVRVVDTLTELLKDPGVLKPEKVEVAKKALARAEARIGTIEIVCEVDGANVDASDGAVGKCPSAGPIKRPPGLLFLTVTANGYAPYFLPIEVKAGQTTTAKLDLVPVDKPLAAITVVTKVPGAEVWVDGVRVGTTPMRSTIPVVAGVKHDVELRRSGYVTSKDAMELQPGATGELTMTLAPDGAALATDGSKLDVKVDQEGAKLLVDGLPVELGGATALPSGVHDVVVTRDGYEPWSSRIELAPRATLPLSLKLVPTTETRAELAASATRGRTIGWALFATGAVLTTAAIPVFVWNRLDAPNVERDRQAYEVNPNCQQGTPNEVECGEIAGAIKRREWRVTGLDVSMPLIAATGLGLGIGGLVMAIGGDDPAKYRLRDPDESARVEVDLGLGHASLRLTY